MLVLLPPSEGKTAPRRGKPADLASLAFAEALTSPRKRVLDAYGPSLLDAPSSRASKVYTGVLFGRLDLPSLPAPARRQVLIFSALWGVLRPDDRIPAYKLPAGTKLAMDGGGTLASVWREALRPVLPDSGLVVDLRSGSYSSFWAPRAAAVVSVRAFTAEGTTISHMVKATRGDVARLVLSAPKRPRRPDDVAELVAASGRDVTLSEARGGWTLDVIER